jgi:rRNA maturation endonuclease Nob1
MDFLRKMTEMNRDGTLAITVYHSLQKEVLALARFSWRCRQCGRVYQRQRRTIEPRRHHCGICRGSLEEMSRHASMVNRETGSESPKVEPSSSDTRDLRHSDVKTG